MTIVNSTRNTRLEDPWGATDNLEAEEESVEQSEYSEIKLSMKHGYLFLSLSSAILTLKP